MRVFVFTCADCSTSVRTRPQLLPDNKARVDVTMTHAGDCQTLEHARATGELLPGKILFHQEEES